jgi:NAD(P)-dependent dehydrogenase (short-subunit alcohol dehydrogenase family)
VRDPHDYTADDMTEVLLTNVVGYLRLIHAFLPLLEKSDDPRIVNVSSGHGSFRHFQDRNRTGAFAGTTLHAASKAAVNMMTVHFARLLPNIRINAADPALTATDLSGGHGHSVHEAPTPSSPTPSAHLAARPAPSPGRTWTAPKWLICTRQCVEANARGAANIRRSGRRPPRLNVTFRD